MFEILYAHTTEQPDPVFTEWTNKRQPKDTRVAVFKHHDKVCITRSTQICGLPARGSTKRYYEWRTVQSLGFRTNNAGNVVAYQCFRPWNYKSGNNWTFHIPLEPFSAIAYDGEDEVYDAFRHAVWQVFGIRKMEDIYPIAGEYGLHSYGLVPADLRRAMRESNWADYTRAIFGSKRSNGRLIAAVADTEPYVVSLANQFRGYVSDEKLLEFVENTKFDDELESTFQPHSPRIRKMVKVMSPATRDSLLSGGIDIRDTRCIKSLSDAWRHSVSAVEEDTHYLSWSELAPWVK